jgi:hypothetical protein
MIVSFTFHNVLAKNQADKMSGYYKGKSKFHVNFKMILALAFFPSNRVVFKK